MANEVYMANEVWLWVRNLFTTVLVYTVTMKVKSRKDTILNVLSLSQQVWVLSYICLLPGCVAVPLIYAPYKCAIPRDSACSGSLSLTQQKRLTSIECFIEYTELGSSLSLSSYSF